MKVTSTISQKGVSGLIAQKGVTGTISQKGVVSSFAEAGVSHYLPVLTETEVGNVDNNTLALTFDKEINPFSVPDNGDFAVTLSGGVVTVTDVQINSDGEGKFYSIEITLSRLVSVGETGTVVYTKGTNHIESKTDDNAYVESFSQAITNNVTGTKPVFVSAAVANATPTKVVLTYDQTLDTGSIPATTDFTVTDHIISGVAIVGATVELTLSTAIIYFDVIYFTYTKGANPIRGDAGGIDADDLASTLITNNVAVTGNEIDQWLASDTANITKDGSNYVSSHKGKINAVDLLQVVGTNQPLWVSPDYIQFDGIDNFLKSAAFTWNQPEFLILVIKQISWTNGDRILDGNATSGGALMQNDSSPELGLYMSGAASVAQNANLAVGDWGIVRVLINGASSSIQINATAKTTGNPGTNNLGGLTLGRQGAGALQWANFAYKEIIGLKVAPSSDYETSLYNVVKRRNGL